MVVQPRQNDREKYFKKPLAQRAWFGYDFVAWPPSAYTQTVDKSILDCWPILLLLGVLEKDSNLKWTFFMGDKKVAEFENTDIGMYAVFRRPSGNTRAHFTSLHLTFEQAESESVRLIAECVKASPGSNQLFFVVRLESFVQFSDGKFSRGGR